MALSLGSITFLKLAKCLIVCDQMGRGEGLPIGVSLHVRIKRVTQAIEAIQAWRRTESIALKRQGPYNF